MGKRTVSLRFDRSPESHVVAETRTVYRGARVAQKRWKLTRHAAYVAVAKTMIANRCLVSRG